MHSLPLTRRTLCVALACVAATLWLAAPALAGGVKAPPGNAGAQEYVESIPDGTGGEVGNKLYHARNDAQQNPGNALSDQTQSALSDAGKDGSQAAALASAGAPDTQKGTGSGGAGSTPAAATANELTGGGLGGLGLFLPLLLVLLLVAAILYELNRRRARS
jgi:hypothetical protein